MSRTYLWNNQVLIERKKLIVLKKSDFVSMAFSYNRDSNGNSYFCALVRINDKSYELPKQYGYHYNHIQAQYEVLGGLGYRVRNIKSNPLAPYYAFHIFTNKVKFSDMFKTFKAI